MKSKHVDQLSEWFVIGALGALGALGLLLVYVLL